LRLFPFAREMPRYQGKRGCDGEIYAVMEKGFDVRPQEAVDDTLDEKKRQNVNKFDHPLDGLFSAAVWANFVVGSDGLTAMYASCHDLQPLTIENSRDDDTRQ